MSLKHDLAFDQAEADLHHPQARKWAFVLTPNTGSTASVVPAADAPEGCPVPYVGRFQTAATASGKPPRSEVSTWEPLPTKADHPLAWPGAKNREARYYPTHLWLPPSVLDDDQAQTFIFLDWHSDIGTNVLRADREKDPSWPLQLTVMAGEVLQLAQGERPPQGWYPWSTQDGRHYAFEHHEIVPLMRGGQPVTLADVAGRWLRVLPYAIWRADDTGRLRVQFDGETVCDWRGPTLSSLYGEPQQRWFKEGGYFPGGTALEHVTYANALGIDSAFRSARGMLEA